MRIKINHPQTALERQVQKTSKAIERLERLSEEESKAREKARQESEKARQESEKARLKSEKEWEDFRIAQEDFRKSQEDFRKSMKAMQKELGGVSNSNGEVAESYFINSFTKSMYFAGQEYDEISHNLRKKIKKLNLHGEYDLVLYNCTSVVIIEIKYNADKDDVEGLLHKAPVFKQLFPQYSTYDIYLGLAALHIDAITEKESLKQGIAVIKQIGDSMVINDAHLKVF